MTERAAPAAGQLAAYAVRARSEGVPAAVAHEAWRCLLNFTGCALGGSTHDAARGTAHALLPFAGAGEASVIGGERRTDPLTAALCNGTAASAHSFDDTHAEAIVHPGAPAGAAALAVAQHVGASGPALLTALALGVEAACRASKAISVAPARGDIAWYQTGICGGIGAALAAGTLLRLDGPALTRALGIAAAQASGTRVFQGSMTMLLLAGHAAQCGVRAAFLARDGVDAPVDSLDGKHGFTAVHAPAPHAAWLYDDLGTRYELLSNTYKAYPCGVVLHPMVDACLALRGQIEPGAQIREARVRLHPVALTLTDRRHPMDRTAAQVSMHHWTAVALARGHADLADGDDGALNDPTVRALRDRVTPVVDDTLARDEVAVEVILDDGRMLVSSRHRGVAPMSDAALERKFRALSALVHAPARVDALLNALRAVPHSPDLCALSALL